MENYQFKFFMYGQKKKLYLDFFPSFIIIIFLGGGGGGGSEG